MGWLHGSKNSWGRSSVYGLGKINATWSFLAGILVSKEYSYIKEKLGDVRCFSTLLEKGISNLIIS